MGKSTKVDDIPAAVFATALLELATIEAGADRSASISDKLTAVAGHYPGTPLASFLNIMATSVTNDLDRYIATVSNWFDDQMTRLTAIYRRNARYVLAVIGLGAAVVFNVDSLDIGRTLSSDADTRCAVVLLADDVANTNVSDPAVCTIDEKAADRDLRCAREALTRLADLKIPVLGTWSWETWKGSWRGGPSTAAAHVIGLLVTAGAVSFGGQFWFDFLRWLTGMRRGA